MPRGVKLTEASSYRMGPSDPISKLQPVGYTDLSRYMNVSSPLGAWALGGPPSHRTEASGSACTHPPTTPHARTHMRAHVLPTAHQLHTKQVERPKCTRQQRSPASTSWRHPHPTHQAPFCGPSALPSILTAAPPPHSPRCLRAACPRGRRDVARRGPVGKSLRKSRHHCRGDTHSRGWAFSRSTRVTV